MLLRTRLTSGTYILRVSLLYEHQFYSFTVTFRPVEDEEPSESVEGQDLDGTALPLDESDDED